MEGQKEPLGREGLGYPAPLILEFSSTFILNCVRVFVYVSVRVGGYLCTCVHTHVEARGH